ncbi:hypothetical protein ACQ4M4_23190 [Leptolyngbya sp. AN02str]|uniref:hypothetical protein n=1 Tax=Leptolyngbya sp. AN02str TaxID=3423363 RepID=UPI003D32023D
MIAETISRTETWTTYPLQPIEPYTEKAIALPLFIDGCAMERGLLWFPLLIFFFGLAYAGWNEYQKLEAYKIWAEQFDRAKYDIRAVLGQKDDTITWGKPTRKGPVNLQTFSLRQVKTIQLWVDGAIASFDSPPEQGRVVCLRFETSETAIEIPFTDVALAVQWGQFLQQHLTSFQI